MQQGNPPETSPLLELDGIRKSFFGVEVLKGVSFSVHPGEVVGLIGENGSGKSTTSNIIGGLLQPNDGKMRLAGAPYAPESSRAATESRIAFIHQELNLFDSLSIAENMSISNLPYRVPGLPFIDKKAMTRRAEELLNKVGLDLDPATKISQLPQGERQLIEIAKSLATDPQIVIFDEPTTSLTAVEAKRLFDLIAQLRSKGIGIIYISHILDDVKRLCDKVVVLRDGVLVDQFTSDEGDVPRMIEGMIGGKLDAMFPPKKPAPADAAPVLEVAHLSQSNVVHDISFELRKGEVLGVAGLMGSGRSELARMIYGLDKAQNGQVLINGRPLGHAGARDSVANGLAFLTEDRRGEGLFMPESILRNLEIADLSNAQGPLARASDARSEAEARKMARSLRIKANDHDRQPVQYLSGGNQQKVVLGKWLLCDPDVFILDEPTRGIDVGAKAEIYRLIAELAERGSGVLVISSEVEELIGVCHRILVMSHGEFVAEFDAEPFDRDAILTSAALPQKTKEDV